jgi:hypothetical protein
VGDFEANIFLISVVAFVALIYGAWRWSAPSRQDEP